MYLVKVRTAGCREVEIPATGKNDEAACKQAVETMEQREPGLGWQAVWALEQ